MHDPQVLSTGLLAEHAPRQLAEDRLVDQAAVRLVGDDDIDAVRGEARSVELGVHHHRLAERAVPSRPSVLVPVAAAASATTSTMCTNGMRTPASISEATRCSVLVASSRNSAPPCSSRRARWTK